MKRFRNIVRRGGLHQEEHGTAMVEFALSFLTVMLAVFMLYELCSCIYTYTVLSEAANEGLRYAVVHTQDPNLSQDVQNRVIAYANTSMHDMTQMTVRVTLPLANAPINTVIVQVSYPYLPFTGFLSNPPTMHAYAEGRLLY